MGFHCELFIVGQRNSIVVQKRLQLSKGDFFFDRTGYCKEFSLPHLGITVMEGSGSRFMAAVVVRFPKFGAPPQLLPRPLFSVDQEDPSQVRCQPARPPPNSTPQTPL